MPNVTVKRLERPWFRVTLPGEAPEEWSRSRLYGFLINAGYSAEDALSYVMQAEHATEVQIPVPPKKPD
jgi:hypothetical protein